MRPRRRFPTPWLSLFVLFLAPLAHASGVPRWGRAGGGPGELRSPTAIALHGERVYVAEFDNDRIQVFTRAGEPLFAWGSSGSGAGEFRGPAGLAVGPDGSVIVADHFNHRLQRFTAEGRYLAGWPAG